MFRLAARIPGERLETFLRVRETTADARREFVGALRQLEAAETGAVRWSFGEALDTFRSGFGPMHRVGGYLEARNAAMLDAGNGRGEYARLHAIAFFAGGRRSPGDGPAFPLVGFDGDGNGDGNGERDPPRRSRDEPGEAVRERRDETVRRLLNRRPEP